MKIRTSLSAYTLEQVIYSVSEQTYDGNLNIEALELCNPRGTVFRLKLGTKDSYGKGSRRSASGRHGRYASWHAFRDVFAAIMAADPHAVIYTALQTYRGAQDFLDTFPETANQNVGSMVAPAYMDELSVDGYEGDEQYIRHLEYHTRHLIRYV